MLKVSAFVINKNTDRPLYGLYNIEENQVIYSHQANWKTKAGAKRYAIKRGWEYIEKED